MTDDSNARYRRSDLRTPDRDGHGSDPLAELARLIGQGEQFAERREPAPPQSRAPQYAEPAPYPAVSEQHFTEPPTHEEPAYEPHVDAHYAPEPAPNAQAAAPGSEWPPFDPFAPASSHQTADLSPQRSSRPEFAFPPQHSQHSGSSSYDAAPLGAPFRQDPGAMQSLHLSSDHALSPPPLDEYYDDAPQGGRRKGLITVAAVFCLAVVGTAGAFGYRTWFGGPSVKSTPAVIKASADPNKVAPPASPADPNANKISYDRFGDRGQNEKVVLREEKPVDLKDATRSGSAMSSVPLPSQPAPAAPPAAAAAANNPPSVLTDPKRVRTVTIRPDAPDASTTRQPMVTPPQAAAPAPAPARQIAAVAPSNAPLDLANPSAPQARAAAPREAPPPAVRPAPAAPSGNAPLSLAPESGNAPAAARSAPTTRVAAAPAAAANGSYLVQVSSQRSEADAQAAFRSVQSKYSSVLGDRQMVIRRADLAGKGTYYRAMVGPFGSRDQAIQLCSSLKAAGGDCVVQSN